MATIDINYTEPNVETYKSVILNISGDKIEFNSGDFIQDWFDLMKYIAHIESSRYTIISHLSSVDHFIMDGAPFDSMYLKNKGEEGHLMEFDDGDGVHFFVDKETKPTWEELKKTYNN